MKVKQNYNIINGESQYFLRPYFTQFSGLCLAFDWRLAGLFPRAIFIFVDDLPGFLLAT